MLNYKFPVSGHKKIIDNIASEKLGLSKAALCVCPFVADRVVEIAETDE